MSQQRRNLCFRFEDTTCQSLFQAANMLPVYIQGYHGQRPDVCSVVSYIHLLNIRIIPLNIRTRILLLKIQKLLYSILFFRLPLSAGRYSGKVLSAQREISSNAHAMQYSCSILCNAPITVENKIAQISGAMNTTQRVLLFAHVREAVFSRDFFRFLSTHFQEIHHDLYFKSGLFLSCA